MENQEFLDQISKKMNAFIALLLTTDVAKMTTADKVKMLLRFNLSNQDIANIIGTTRGTIEVMKSRLQKPKNKDGQFKRLGGK